jgi:glycosyltransferase involved in cell wall biosynthesis
MYRNLKVAAIVPAYNVEKLVGRVIETMPSLVDRVYVVDDASRDQTRETVLQYQASSNGLVRLIEHSANGGVGAAIVSGYTRALEDGMDLMAVLAGDGQMDPTDLERLLQPVADGKVDYAKGNRLFTGEAWRIIPKVRYFGNAVLSLLTKMASGYWHVADSQSGYTVISREALAELPLGKLYPRYGFPNHMLALLNVYGLRVKDVPVRPVYGVGEKSGIRLSRVIPSISWLLVKCFLWRLKEKYIIRDFHPLMFFLAFGGLLLLSGTALGLYCVYLRYSEGGVALPAVIFSAFLNITGLQSLFLAMWMDMEYNKTLR